MALPVKAPAVTTYTPSWAGWYAGLNVGGVSERSAITGLVPTGGTSIANYCFGGFGAGLCNTSNYSQTASGVIGGLQLGYNFQTGRVVYGVEADVDLASASKTTNGVNTGGSGGGTWTVKSGIHALSTVRGRIGYAFDNVLIYATGGLAVAKTADSFQGSTPVFGSGAYSWADVGWRAGYAVGGGLEYQFARNWSLKGEAFYYDLGHKDLVSLGTNAGAAFTGAFGLSDRMTGWVARAGINYFFH